jgi:phage protein D/phage baseplate assembly protein gpV
VEADGSPLPDEAARSLAQVTVRQELSLPSQCELTFADPPGPLSAAASLAPGAALRVLVHGHDVPLFEGQVTAVERAYLASHERRLLVRGYDVLHRLRKRQAARVHVQVTLRGLAEELVADLGLAVESAGAGPRWPRLIQHRQSDLDLLVSLAERCGLYLSVRGNALHLLTLDGEGEPLPLTLGETLLEARLELNGDPACRAVAAAGWNPLRVELHAGRAGGPRVGRDVAAEAPPERLGGSGTLTLFDELAPDDLHAEALAQAELDRRVAAEVTLWGVAEGDPRLRPGAVVEVAGVEPALAGRYVVSTVAHTIDARSGYVSEIDSTPPPQQGRPTAASVTLGVVTRVDDPDTLGRVCATLPAYGDVETDWMGVLSAGAGPGKGLVALPDVGDHVLLLLPHEDPAQGVVLGGLYGMQGPPDSGVEDGAVRRYSLRTAGGHSLRVDDVGRAIRVEDSQGSYVELAPEVVRLFAAADLDIAAPGRAVTIRGQSIDFRRA